MAELAPVALTALHSRITGVFPAQIRAAIAELTDEQIWWRPNEKANSVGNLMLHLAGSINHYLNRGIGGIEYSRDRAAEFAERRTIPRDELLVIFDDMVSKAEQTFAAMTPERLSDASPEAKMYSLVFEDVLGVAAHMSFHAGQIVWIAKMLREGAVDEVWMWTHKKHAAWKKP
jgi:uncharacterized damage-inducible protein DinB